MGTVHRSGALKKSSDSARIVIATIIGVVFGFFVGLSFPSVSLSKINLPSSIISSLDVAFIDENRSTRTKTPETRGSSNVPKVPAFSLEKSTRILQTEGKKILMLKQFWWILLLLFFIGTAIFISWFFDDFHFLGA